jgi:CO dehydrogenase nickel-insertion accessory protein CooC1
METMVKEEAKRLGYEFAGIIPPDDNIFNYNLTGKSLLTLPAESPALSAVKDILTRIGLLS